MNQIDENIQDIKESSLKVEIVEQSERVAKKATICYVSKNPFVYHRIPHRYADTPVDIQAVKHLRKCVFCYTYEWM